MSFNLEPASGQTDLDLPGHHLVFQPIVETPFLDGGPVLYWEVLSRYRTSQGEIRTPVEWLNHPRAAVLLDRAVLEKSIPWTRADCPIAPGTTPRIGINANALSLLDEDYMRCLLGHLEDDCLPHRLVIELTETFIMEAATIDPLLKILNRLHEAGVAVALDDFGTGGAGVGMFSLFPFDYVKVSPWLDAESTRGHALLEALLTASQRTADEHPFEIILEGVEDAEHYGRVHGLGVHGAQGFHIGRPAPQLRRPRGLERRKETDIERA